MAESKVIEGPAGYGPHGGPKGAEKLPTKHYAETTAMAEKGKHNTLEGPCENKEGYHK